MPLDGFQTEQGKYHELFPGTNDGLGYAFVVVAMTKSGCYELPVRMIARPTSGDVHYFASHAGIDTYTAAAILLALGVLWYYPDYINDAAEAMLGAPDLLEGR